MADKYNGINSEGQKTTTEFSTNSGNAVVGRGIALNSNSKLDESLLPAGIVPQNIKVLNEGIEITSGLNSIDFVGLIVNAAATGGNVTVTINESVTSLEIEANQLRYTDELGNVTVEDLSVYLDDTNLARVVSGEVDENGLATFTRDDDTFFTIDFSQFFDNVDTTYTFQKTGANQITVTDSNSNPTVITLDGNDDVKDAEQDVRLDNIEVEQVTQNESIAQNATDLGDHISDFNNPHQVTPVQLGLENVDNTSDANKPVSIATQAALDLKVNISDFNASIPDLVCLVKQPSDIVNKTLDSNCAYIIDVAELVLSDGEQIRVPEEGLVLIGRAPKIGKIRCDANNYTMFVNEGVLSGSLRFIGLTFTTSGANSMVFNLDNQNDTDNENNNIDWTDVNFVECNSIGILSNYRQFFWDVGSAIACNDGIEFAGDWSGGVVLTSNRSIIIGGSFVKAGAGLTIGSRFLTNMNFTGISGATSCDFSPSNILNDADFEVNRARFEGGNVVTDYFPNFPVTNRKANFVNNTGESVENTNVGADIAWTTTTLTPLTAGVPAKAAGTTVLGRGAWFSQTANNEITYQSSVNLRINIDALITVNGNSADLIAVSIRKWDDSASNYVVLDRRLQQMSVIGFLSSSTENISLKAVTDMQENDRIEIWIENTQDESDYSIATGSKVLITGNY